MKIFLSLLFTGLLFQGAASFAMSPELQQCITNHTSCIQTCTDLETEGAQAGCITKCAGTQASCAGQVGLTSTKTFLDQKLDQLDQFLNDFLHDMIPAPEGNVPNSKDAEGQNT